MEYFGLSLEEEKSSLIEFGRYAKARCQKLGKKPETFTFLGFTHYCSQGPHWGQTPLLLWETFGRFLFLGLKFEKSLYNLNAMEKVFIRF